MIKKSALSIVLALLIFVMMLPSSVIITNAESAEYSIGIRKIGNGSVSVDPVSAAAGDYVTVTMTAGKGWFIRQMLVIAEDGEQITRIDYNSASFEEDVDGFTMPDQNVTLTVTFAKPEDFSDDPTQPVGPTPHQPGDMCSVSFDSNGGDGSMSQTEILYGESYTLPECKYTKENREFYKWEINGTEYDADDTIIVTDDILLTAIWKHTSTYTIDNSYDSSTTQVVGILKLKDLRTGDVTEYTVADMTLASSYTEPSDPDVNALIEETKDELCERLSYYDDAQKNALTVSEPTVLYSQDDRSYTYFDGGGYDENRDYFTKALIIDGVYYKNWKYAVTLEAEYTSVPMSYIHVLSTDGGMIDFYCEEYNGDYTQPYAVPEDAEVTLYAIPEQGYEFEGWYKGDVNASSYNEMFTDELITVDNPYVFNSTGYPYICAKFKHTGVVWPQGDQIQVWITDGGKASVAYEPSVKGNPYVKPKDGNNFVEIGEVVPFWRGDEITVTAKPDKGYSFKGWYHVNIEWGPGNGKKYEGDVISTDISYSYKPGVTVVDGDTEPLRYICAVFEISADPDTEYLLGDADGNGEVDIVDATFVQRFLTDVKTPFTKEQLMRADVDGSGDLEITDVTAIRRWLIGLGTPFSIGTFIS